MATIRRSFLLICPKTYSLCRQLVDYKKSRLFSAIASQGQKKTDGHVDSPPSMVAADLMRQRYWETPTTHSRAMDYDDLCRRSLTNLTAADNIISLLTQEHYQYASIHHRGGNANARGGSSFKLSSIIRLSLFAEHNELRMIRRNHNISAPWEIIPVSTRRRKVVDLAEILCAWQSPVDEAPPETPKTNNKEHNRYDPHQGSNASNSMDIGTRETTEVMSQKVENDADQVNLVQCEREATEIRENLGRLAYHINELNIVDPLGWRRNDDMTNGIVDLVENVLELVMKLDSALAFKLLGDHRELFNQWYRVPTEIAKNVYCMTKNLEQVKELKYTVDDLMMDKFRVLWIFDLSKIDENEELMASNFELAKKLDIAREKMIAIKVANADLEFLRSLGFYANMKADVEQACNASGRASENPSVNMKAVVEQACNASGRASENPSVVFQLLEDMMELVTLLECGNDELVADNMALLGDIILEKNRSNKANNLLFEKLDMVAWVLDEIHQSIGFCLEEVEELQCSNVNLMAESREILRKLEVALGEVDVDEEMKKLLWDLTLAIEDLKRIKLRL